MAMDDSAFKAAMARLASGVTVVTTRVDDEDHGFTATSFTSLSLSPPLVLVCVMKSHRNHEFLLRSEYYAVSVLGEAQDDLGLRFASSKTPNRFLGLALHRSATGAAILPGAIAWVDCRVRDVFDGGDHSIFVGEVLDSGVSAGAPLLDYDRRWGGFTPQQG
jgi:flavin reductase (DIM6/NTAB) family NADH-FMN oxidoreductase RutF